jgi:hypothetical protein
MGFLCSLGPRWIPLERSDGFRRLAQQRLGPKRRLAAPRSTWPTA